MLTDEQKTHAIKTLNAAINDDSLEESDAKKAYRLLSQEQQEYASAELLRYHYTKVAAWRARNGWPPVAFCG